MLEKQGTNLPLMQEIAYNIMKSNSPFVNDSGYDYDLRGYYLKYGSLNPKKEATNGHLDDEFKYYHHPAFSTLSRYYTGQPYAIDWKKEPYKTLSREGLL